MDDINELQNECYEEIIKVIEDYKDNNDMLLKIRTSVFNINNIISNANLTAQKKEERTNKLIQNQNIFKDNFMNHNKFFYLNKSNIDTFFIYDGKLFNTIDEDNVHKIIMDNLNDDKNITPWKFKTKISIMKDIKDKLLFNAIPESETMQYVINNLYPSVFNSKDEVKYFLIVIGDYVLKKKTNAIYFISNTYKSLLNDISDMLIKQYQIYGLNDVFKSKYQEHNFDAMRLIKIKGESNYIKDFFSENIITISCVCTYYSNKFGSSELFLKKRRGLQKYVNFFKNKTKNDIIKIFYSKYISSSDSSNISLKNMIFLWKMFLHEENIPCIIYLNTLKQNICSCLNIQYNDGFVNVKSNVLDEIQKFLQFWNDEIYLQEGEYNYYELQEVYNIFLDICDDDIKWNVHIISKIVNYYLPNSTIKGNVVYNVVLKKWDKRHQVVSFIEKYIEENDDFIIYDSYECYVKDCHEKNIYIAHKKYYDNICLSYFNL